MQVSRQRRHLQAVPSVHQSPAHRPLHHNHQLVLQQDHRPMPAPLPARGNRSRSQASRHVARRRRKVPSGSGDTALKSTEHLRGKPGNICEFDSWGWGQSCWGKLFALCQIWSYTSVQKTVSLVLRICYLLHFTLSMAKQNVYWWHPSVTAAPYSANE